MSKWLFRHYETLPQGGSVERWSDGYEQTCRNQFTVLKTGP